MQTSLILLGLVAVAGVGLRFYFSRFDSPSRNDKRESDTIFSMDKDEI